MLYITIGISGSGKSTWVRNHMKNNDILICPDNIRKELTGDISDNTRNNEVWNIAYYRLRKADTDNDIYFDSTCLNRRTLNEILRNNPNANEYTTIVFFNDSENWNKCFSRVTKDEKNGVDRAKTSGVVRNGKPLIQDMSERYSSFHTEETISDILNIGLNIIEV